MALADVAEESWLHEGDNRGQHPRDGLARHHVCQISGDRSPFSGCLRERWQVALRVRAVGHPRRLVGPHRPPAEVRTHEILRRHDSIQPTGNGGRPARHGRLSVLRTASIVACGNEMRAA